MMTEQKPWILLVEDELHLAQGIRENLEAEGYSVELAGDGKLALEMIRAGHYDLIVLDVMLPEVDGFTVCETMRAEEYDIPVLFLTARGGVDDRIRGLEAGGDDYLPKPFQLRELLLRVAVILKRRSWYGALPEDHLVLHFGRNVFNFRTHAATAWDGMEQSLTQKEALILRALAEADGEVVTREDLLDKVWGYELFPSTRMLDNFIMRLRKRFEQNPENPQYILTVRGVGYRFDRDGKGAL